MKQGNYLIIPSINPTIIWRWCALSNCLLPILDPRKTPPTTLLYPITLPPRADHTQDPWPGTPPHPSPSTKFGSPCHHHPVQYWLCLAAPLQQYHSSMPHHWRDGHPIHLERPNDDQLYQLPLLLRVWGWSSQQKYWVPSTRHLAPTFPRPYMVQDSRGLIMSGLTEFHFTPLLDQ